MNPWEELPFLNLLYCSLQSLPKLPFKSLHSGQASTRVGGRFDSFRHKAVNRRAYTANSFHGASEQHFKRLSVFYEIWIMILGLNSALPRLLASFPTLSSNLNNLSQANYQGKFIYRRELKNCPHQKCHFEVHTTLLTIIEMTVLPRSLHRPWRPPRKMNFTLQI